MLLQFKQYPEGDRAAIDEDNVAGFERTNATTPNTIIIVTYVGGNYEAFRDDMHWAHQDQNQLDWVLATQG